MATSGLQSGGERRKRPHKWLCGLSTTQCCGSYINMPHGNRKAHTSPQEAFRCYTRYLLSEGYTQIGSKEFYKGDSPILVLTKPSRFGSMLRYGKGKAMVFKKQVAGGII